MGMTIRSTPDMVLVEARPVSREQVIAEARSWVGTPWRHQGRLKGVAADCAGLIVGAGQELRALRNDPWCPVLANRFSGYPMSPNSVLMSEALNLIMDRITWDEAGPGDVVHWRFNRAMAAAPQHLSILTAGKLGEHAYTVHALRSAGKVVEHRLYGEWLNSIAAAYRYPGLSMWLENQHG